MTGLFLGLIRFVPAPDDPLHSLPQIIFQRFGLDGRLVRIPRLPGGYSIPFPVYCLAPHDIHSHVVVVVDSRGQWRRPVIQVVPHSQSFEEAIAALSTQEMPHSLFWKHIRDMSPAFYTVPVTLGLVTLSLVAHDDLRAMQYGWSFTQHEAVESISIESPAPRRAVIDIGTQTTPNFWPALATARESQAIPQIPKVQSCLPLLDLCPNGPLTHLECPQFQIACTLPCLPGYFPWGLRVGIRVFGVCTSEVTWQHVLTIAESNAWDLSGMEILGEDRLWRWSEDVSDLAGRCGHLLQSGSDPLLCTGRNPDHLQAPGQSPGPSGNVTPPVPCSSTARCHSANVLPLIALLSSVRGSRVSALGSILWPLILAAKASLATRSLPSSENASCELPDLAPQFDATRTCTVAWCHELSCQTNAFMITTDAIHQYVRQVSPDQLVRCHLWRPYQGPAVFEFARDTSQAAFEALLTTAGHETGDALFTAYDTLGTTLELLSVPFGPVRWWIVRDGLGRELLRPVTTWSEPGARYVLTLNSHGQAQALSCVPEVSRMHDLPQGVRATVTMLFPSIAGHMSSQGIVLVEVAIGALSISTRSHIALAVVLASILHHHFPAQGMQMSGSQHPTVLVASRWNEPQPDPAITRIWTYTCDAPVEVPFVPAPEPALMYHQVGSNGRGIPAAGDFVWTQPRIVQGCAHIIHFPPRAHPPFVFWLLHFQARGHVVAASDTAFDWAYIGALAAEAFNEPWFSQGAYGIVLHGRVLSYGEAIGVPPHGTILHLTRTSLQPRAGQSIWDTPADPGCVIPFDYDICRGHRGHLPVYPLMPTGPATSTGSTQPARRESDNTASLSLGHQLNRQILDVGNDLQILITRLETAGVLPAPEVAPWVTQDPAEPADHTTADRAEHSRSEPLSANLHRGTECLLVAVLHREVGPFMSGTICLLLQLLPAWGQDHDHEEDTADEGPSEPSSPATLADIAAPTPLTSLHTVSGNTPVVRPSVDPLAATSMPGQESLSSSCRGIATCDVAVAQHRFACALRDIQLEVPDGDPFIPAGVPVIMHNPFTGRPQCRLWTTTQHTPRILLNTLQDYAQRRGWQSVCDVYPQPDNAAVHLMPSAASEGLVAVVLQTADELHPRCVPRSLSHEGTGAVTINGRAGRVRAPYPARAHHQRTATLGDGDCLPVNFGPYGPPPPQPVHDSASRLGVLPTLSVGIISQGSWSFLIGVTFLLAAAMERAPSHIETTKPIYRISAFPWRADPDDRTASEVSDRSHCRFTALCPWTGPQGVYVVPSDTRISDVWRHYGTTLPGWPDQQFAPTWPGLRHDRITVVPIPPCPSLACIVIRQSYHARAVLIHSAITYEHLLRIIQHHTPWNPTEALLPLALAAARSLHHDPLLRLRSGDIIDILEGTQTRQVIGANNPSLLRGYAAWNHGVGILCTTLIRLWDTSWNRPIITWLSPGDEWDSTQLTFTGSFSASYPGRWVPNAWSPSRILQFMRASDRTGQVHILIEQEDRTLATVADATCTREELAEALHTPTADITAIGPLVCSPHSPCVLRDGDIVRAVPRTTASAPVYGWPDDDTGDIRPTLDLGLAYALGTGRGSWVLLSVLTNLIPAYAVRPSQPDRSRSSSPASPHSSRCSPRPSRWRPDQNEAFLDVASLRMDYSVLCPFHGWSQHARCLRDTAGHTIQSVMQRWCQLWAPRYVLVGGLEPTGPIIVIPGGLSTLATILVFTPGSLTAELVPRITTYRRLVAFLRRLSAGCIRLRVPPSLRIAEHFLDSEITLRDGDSFELYNDAAHSAYRPGLQAPTVPFNSLPHFTAWHMPFRLGQSGWVRVWSAQHAHGREAESVWVGHRYVWSPHWCQFQPPGTLPSTDRLIPAVGLEDDQCHFVRQSPFGQAQVLLRDPGSQRSTRCVCCPATNGEQAFPRGWRLRADIAARSTVLHLRDGDVMVPGGSSTRRRVQTQPHGTIVAVSLAWGTVTGRLSKVLLSIGLLTSGALGMHTPPSAATQPAFSKPGRYDWRTPEPLRICDATVTQGISAVLMSPFSGRSDCFPISHSTAISEIRDNICQDEPPWYADIAPVWPSISRASLVFVPVPIDSSLVVIVIAVVTADWQAAFLIPSFTTLDWLLATLQRSCTYPIFSIWPPPSVPPVSGRHIRWRSGDVVLAQACTITEQYSLAPTLTSRCEVRHAALWHQDFIVSPPLTLILWRPSMKPVRTTMPPHAHWSAQRSTFLGELETRYPGQWVPVPWANDDKPHLCQRAPTDGAIHIIHERPEEASLRGDCLQVPSPATLNSIATFVGVRPQDLTLLGSSDDSATLEAREGDIVFQRDPIPVRDPCSGSCANGIRWPVMLLLTLGTKQTTLGLTALAASLTVGSGMVAKPVSHKGTSESHWVWSPYRGKLGPYQSQSLQTSSPLLEEEPWWDSSLTRAHPALHATETHWVPGSPSPLFANVLVVGPPAPTAILIPSRLQKRRLFAVLCSYFPGTAVISGQIQNLADHIPPTADIILRDGDVITTHGSGWSPSIHYVAPDSFVNHASARSQGRWSHPLSFYSDCWVLLWSPDVDSPTAIYAEGRQTWDPAARTLIPALQHLPNGWWPSPRGGPDITEPLHLVETSGEICRANILHWNQPRCCQVMMTGLPRYRDGDVLTAPDTAKPRTAQSRHPQTGPDSRGHAAQPASAGLVIALLISLAFGIPGTVGPPRAGYPWALAILACYLAAKGSTGNCTTTDQRDACWELDMTAPARLTADLHQYWWSRPLHQHLPCEAPMQARFAWDSFPQSSGGVPSSLFIATDGSGTGNGSWAFLAWGLFSNRWHKIRSATAPLPDTPWVPPGESTSAPQLASFQGELAALESAGLWVSAMLDMWYLHMRARPALVTIAVDNASALQVAAGHGQANIPLARLTRQACQSAQARINTRFCHVHSHTGLLANSLADALATLAAHRHPLCRIGPHAVALTPEDFQHHFARLWLVPTCTLSHGTPIIKVPKLAEAPKQPEPLEPTVPQDQEAAPVATQPLSIHVITANVQTIKDAPISVFNPSGLAARRQYLYLQAKQCSADIICLQETRSAAGRWKGPGLLTWRSGALKGQYGCEIWVRPAAADPALTLQDWRIIAASPRLIAVTCLAARFPVTVICAHAPHSDRPDGEARDFWQELTAITRRAPPHRALVIGVDANGDLHSSDEEQALIGDLTAATEVARNDELLLEFCLINGLEAPATFSDIQRSPSWTWQHTSGRQKRLDHILYRPGPWRHTLAAQALDFDIVNGARDHVAMRVRSDLTCPRPPAKTTPRRRASREEIVGFGNEVWSRVTATAGEWNHPEASVEALHRHYNKAMQNLPPRPIAHVVQPYLHPHTIHHLLYLRDWRSQVRTLQRGLRLILLRAVWQAWRGTDPVPHFTIYQHRLVLGAYVLHEHRLQSKVHGLARKDKIRQFTHLTRRAVDDWHRTGQPIQAVAHLRWASKRSADRRSVHAAGGYDIDAELEEQFRAQEGGLRMSPRQLQDRINAWTSRAAPPCKGALPTLLDLEQCCLRQKDGKAPGPDQIPNELYRHFPAYAGRWLWKVCAYAALSGHEPKQFRGALQCALYKRGPASMPSNYRSIALLNGAAKMWHSHIRGTVGARLLQHYDPFQLGGRKHIPVAFAAAKFRTVWDLCTQQGRCAFALFIDIQAAYYETSRQLLFHGDASLPSYEDWRLQHLAQLTEELARNGALALLGTPDEETALLLDCVSCSHWHMVGSSNLFLATRGSRPGDGLADILFGGLFSIALRHIRRACAAEGLAHTSAGTYIGRPAEIIPVGWADDLAILADFPDPSSLKACAPRVADIAIATLEHLRFRVNLGPGKTEAMMDIRGPEAKKVRGELLTGASELQLPDGRAVRISAEYRYLGVIQQPRDTGRRDQELALKRAQAAWAHARGLVTSASLPWELRHAWIASRVLPAAYATLATSTAVSGRAKAPLEGFFERATRALAASWQHGHVLSKPTLYSVACLTAPDVATTVARARLVTQLCRNSPEPVWEVFEAGWSRATTLCGLLTDACQQVLPAIHQLRDHSHVTLPLIQQHSRLFHKACQHLSRHGTVYRTFWDLWRDVAEPRSKKILGAPGCFLCALCSQTFPSRHALAAHIHRRHSVVNSLTLYTAGTICLWCHVDHHSTDRLKYHLKHSHRCMHGLRVTVGQAYTYGSGTKRKGAQGHRGLPPTPLPGPVNATPAQRLAALESREATSHELQAELFRATGVTDVYAWPANPPTEVLSDTHHDDVVTGLAYAASTVPVEPPERFACRLLVDAFAESSGAFPSPFWPGLANETVCWGLPSGWHRWWRLWLSADTVTDPWSFLARAAQRPLRPAPGSGMAHHSTFLQKLCANTIAFRQICLQVQHKGLLWIHGVPSTAGLALLRRVLPRASFRTVQSDAGVIFVAAHSQDFVSKALASLISVSMREPRAPPCTVSGGLFLQPPLVYRTRSLAGAS